MKSKIILCLALVLSGTLFAADSKNFDKEKIDALWPELWKMGATSVEAPTIAPLSEQQALKEMIGEWRVTFGPYHQVISLSTNQEVIIHATNMANWEKRGSWRVISGKLILFLPEDSLPLFIFRSNDKTYIYNPFSTTLMSEMGKFNPVPQINLPPSVWEPVLATDEKISEAQILKILSSIDAASASKNAAAVVVNFATNAIITGTMVGKKRTDTNKDDTDSYRQKLESGFKNLDELIDYKVQRNDVKIEITPDDQQASSISILIETYQWNGSPGKATTKESDTFKIFDGRILLIKMDLTTTTD